MWSPVDRRGPVRLVLLGSLGLSLAVSASTAPAAGAPVQSRDPAGVTARPLPAAVDPSLLGSTGEVGLLVQEHAWAGSAPERAVARVGGRVTRDLPLVHGFAAVVPAARVPELAGVPGVRVLSRDGSVQLQATPTTAAAETASSQSSPYTRVVGAEEARTHRRLTGTGVTVAVIDSGIADLPELAGRIVPVTDSSSGTTALCQNLSGEADCRDSYGHGTFMAGIIAGAGTRPGIAPGARVLSVKIAGQDGSADVSQVLAAIQWVVSFREEYGIRVLNLSLGTDSTQTYELDPLNYAVQRAWSAGIAVVVAASNRGPGRGTISKPGDDPFVITVGATDDRGSVSLQDDTLPGFSGRGPTASDGLAKPDLVAPGAFLWSLRAPGSSLGSLPGTTPGTYLKGSGTSMAAAVVSGISALLLQAQPASTPDRVKFALMASGRPAASSDPHEVGAGTVDTIGALQAPPGVANTGLTRNTTPDLVSLDPSRGSVRVRALDPEQTVLTGATTAQIVALDPFFVTGMWTPTTWSLSPAGRLRWYGTSWHGSDWSGVNWHGSTYWGEPMPPGFYGVNWHGSAWYGAWG